MLLKPQLAKNQENHFLKWNGTMSSDWTLLSLSGHEDISKPYSYDILSMTSLSDKEISKLHGQKVSCKIGGSSNSQLERYIHGIVTHIERDRQIGGDDNNSFCVLRIEPSFALTRMGLSMRVWKNITVPDLVKLLLSENNINHLDFKLHDTYQKREYCIQYRESDFDFISRLLEEEGIYYFFEHELEQHKMVLADNPSSHTQSDSPFISWHHHMNALSEKCIYNWKSMSDVIPSEVLLLGYNMQQTTTISGRFSSQSDFKKIDNITYKVMLQLAERTTLSNKAKAWMEAYDTNTTIFKANTNAYWLGCGEVFILKDHPEDNDKYRIQGLTISASNGFGENADEFHSHMSLLRHSVNWRPVCTRTPPQISGVLTAKVVGPDGEDIHTDEFGRIKIKFHWDQKSTSDGSDSCWVRVSQPWSGNMYGTQFIPRVGSEVLVNFIQGNPDYPLVTGSVYNGQNKPPFTLPADKFESGFMSRSINGGVEDGNRISFNDKKGEEKLIISSQKDLHLTVKNNASTHVEKDVSNIIGKSRNTTIKSGNDNLELKEGNYILTTENGNVCIDAKKAIELKVGSNTINISSEGIALNGSLISIQSKGKVDLGGEGPTTIKGRTIEIG